MNTNKGKTKSNFNYTYMFYAQRNKMSVKEDIMTL